ncbi:MAG: ABC transporter permease [Acidobacteriota bacterium]
MGTVLQDISFGIRALLKKPGLTIVAILSLAIGIGANSAIFTVTNALLLSSLGYKDADRLAILWNRSPGLNIDQDWFSLGQYLDIKSENQVFDEVAVTIGGSYNFTGHGIPEHIEGAQVSSSIFSLFGVEPFRGRIFSPEEDEKGKATTVILSHGFWLRRFGGDADTIGKSLVLNDKSYTIVGVMPAEFVLNKELMPTVSGILKADILLPLTVNESDRSKRDGEDFNIFAKLKSGVSIAKAQEDMNAIAEQMKQQYPQNYPSNGGLTISVVPLLEQVVGDIRLPLYILSGAVICVLLIACANVANLLLARAATRQKEMAIRSAIGASRLRIIRQLLIESLLLSIVGGCIGLGFSYMAIKVVQIYGSANIPRLNDIEINERVLLFTIFISFLTGIIFGLVPALRATRVDLNNVLKDGGRSSSGTGSFGRGHYKLTNLLVISEVALSLVLLIAAGLLIRSYQRIEQANLGFNPRNVLSLRLSLPSTRYNTPDSVIAFYKRLDEKVKELPGIQNVASSYLLPLSSNSAGWEPTVIDGYVPKPGEDLIISTVNFIAPEYFSAMGIRLIKGRPFDERDIKGAQEVAIVNEHLAQRFWPGEEAIGKRVQRANAGTWRTVIGVVSNQKEFSLESEPPITVYYPINQFPIRSRYLVVKSSNNSTELIKAVSSTIQEIDPELPIYDVNTMEQRLSDSLAKRRFAMYLLFVFAVFALLLAIIGIYGVISYWVNQRTHEIGIRMALGAEQKDILKLVVGQAMALILIGIGVGLLGAFGLAPVLSSLLFGISATDKMTFLIISLTLAIVGLIASFLPARRAAKVAPVIALHYE